MIKIGVTHYFGNHKFAEFPVKVLARNGKDFIYHAAEAGGGRFNESLARKVAQEMRDALVSKSYNPVPLDPAWVKRKLKHGWDPRIGFMTGTMFANITHWRPGGGFQGTGSRGWSAGIKDTESGQFGQGSIMHPVARGAAGDISLAQVTKYFEFGAMNQIRRPYLRYALDKVLQKEFHHMRYKMIIKPFIGIWDEANAGKRASWYQKSWGSGDW